MIPNIFDPDRTDFSTKLKMRKDPMIALGLWTVKAPLTVSDFKVTCHKDNVVAAFVEQQLRSHWPSFMRRLLMMLDFGWQVIEPTYEVGNCTFVMKDGQNNREVIFQDAVCLKSLKDVNPMTIEPVYDGPKDEFIGIQQAQGKAEPVFIPRDRIIVATNDGEWGNVEGKSLLDNSYRPWYYSFIVEQLWARFMERRVLPPIVATGPTGSRQDEEGNTYQNEDIMLQVVNNIHHGNGAYLPFEPDSITGDNAFKIELLQAFAQSDQYQTFMATMDGRMLRGLLIPDKALIQGTKVGTLSETEAFTDTFLTGLDGIIFYIQTVVQGLVDQIVRLNFSPAPHVKVEITQITAQRRSSLREIVQLLLNASQMNSKGVQFRFPDMIDFESLARQIGIPVKNPEDILLRDETEQNGSSSSSAPGKKSGSQSGESKSSGGSKGPVEDKAKA